MKALFIGAHTDECDYGCGGLTWLLSRQGVQCRYLCTATRRFDVELDEESKEIYRQNIENSAMLGAEKLFLNEPYETAFVADNRMIAAIEKQILDYQPELVFIQWKRDNHPEHCETAIASYKALSMAAPHGWKVKEIYAYEAGLYQTPDYFCHDFAIDVTEAMPTVEKNMRSFNYKHANGAGLWREKELSCRYRGHTHGAAYAECYKIIKFPDGGDDFILRQLMGSKFHWSGNAQYPAYGREYF